MKVRLSGSIFGRLAGPQKVEGEKAVMPYKRTEYKSGPENKYLNPFFPDSKITADMFWLYFPVEVRALRDMEPSERFVYAMDLLARGFLLVGDVMIFEVDPITYINLCFNQGYRWVTAWGDPTVPVAPGITFPGMPSYDPAAPPKRSIPISLDPAAYPPHDPPPPVVQPGTPAPTLNVVGDFLGGGYYGRGHGANPQTVEHGKPYVAQDGKTVYAHVVSGGTMAGMGSGWSCFFTINPVTPGAP